MANIFVGGPRSILTIPDEVKGELSKLASNGHKILVGDCGGCDTAIQRFFAEIGYKYVIVYASGKRVRNNVGNFPVLTIPVPSGIPRHEFYILKDKEMAKDADEGFFVWDNISRGTESNIQRLSDLGKPVLIFNTQEFSFSKRHEVKFL